MNYLSTMSDIPEFATTVLESGQFYVPRPLMEHCLPEFGANGVTAYALLLDRLRNQQILSIKVEMMKGIFLFTSQMKIWLKR